MATRKIEIEDTLDSRTDAAWDEVVDLARNWLDDNADPQDGEPPTPPDLYNDLDYSGAVHEIVDGAVPIYTAEIRDTWYLHADELEEAYENAGIGTNPRENDGMAAIYCHIEQQMKKLIKRGMRGRGGGLTGFPFPGR